MLKIDVEGTEIAALEGAVETIKRNPSICIMVDAIHYPNEDRDVVEYLKRLGFTTNRIEDFIFAKRPII